MGSLKWASMTISEFLLCRKHRLHEVFDRKLQMDFNDYFGIPLLSQASTSCGTSWEASKALQ